MSTPTRLLLASLLLAVLFLSCKAWPDQETEVSSTTIDLMPNLVAAIQTIEIEELRSLNNKFSALCKKSPSGVACSLNQDFNNIMKRLPPPCHQGPLSRGGRPPRPCPDQFPNGLSAYPLELRTKIIEMILPSPEYRMVMSREGKVVGETIGKGRPTGNGSVFAFRKNDLKMANGEVTISLLLNGKEVERTRMYAVTQ